MKQYLIFALFACYSVALFGQLKAPGEFLPHQLGEHFTPHHMLVDYYQHVAAHSPLVKLVEYGRSNQDRPLIMAIVTSEANHARLDDIRLNNLKMTGLESGTIDEAGAKAIVWLSFSVHGNEAAGSEAAHQVIYDLVNPNEQRTKAWLDNTVVILDPSINPDGYSRYTHWVRNVTMDENNPDIQDIEHNEPWPGGRVNHYLFDLNRDWAWQTQVESQQRMKVYNQWLPHVHADLHEMGHESSYYFAPAAKPYHSYIRKWQREFQHEIGKNHAKYFDKNGWMYFTKEVFDLFYPSYGDTYPTFSGAIGMTYEQGGSRVGGRGVTLENGEMLTLKDRIDHHLTTALSTIEITSVNAERVIDEFQKFYNETSSNPPGKYKTFVFKKDHSGERISALRLLLDRQDIQYQTPASTTTFKGFDYNTRTTSSMEITPGDLVVSAHQPKGLMAQILLEPSSTLEDSLTYDITAWSLPYAYGLSAMASEQKISGTKAYEEMSRNKSGALIRDAYAYIIPHTDMTSVATVSQLSVSKVQMRVLSKDVEVDGQKFGAGSALITKADNKKLGDKLLQYINEAYQEYGTSIHPLATGFATSGPDLGSNRNPLMKRPKVLAIGGEGTNVNAFGQIKWYFDRVIDYPLSVVDINRLGRTDLNRYNTIILPDGWYRIPSGVLSKLSTWVSQGGKLIAIGSANRNLMDQDGFGLKKYATDSEKSAEKSKNKAADLAARYNHYSEQERLAISNYVPGAIFELDVDSSHPLGYGLGDTYFSLRTSSTTLPVLVGAENVIIHPKEPKGVIGFAGNKIRERLNDSAAFLVESKGRGNVIYMADNPLFRGFWYNGLFLFSNALFLVD